MFQNIILVARQIPGNQFFLTKWISIIFGYIINFIFDIVHNFTVINSLGISLVFLTIIARAFMIPVAFRQQKSMFMLNKMQPEMNKIQEKYANKSKDPEISKKMNMEMQKLYAKYNYNPLSGCLPLLVQLPIFIALYYVMQNPSLYINAIHGIYENISQFIAQLDENTLYQSINGKDLAGILLEKIPSKILASGEVTVTSLLPRILGVFTAEDWRFLSNIAQQAGDAEVSAAISEVNNIVNFCGINLTENVSDNIWHFQNFKFLIPVISGLSTFFSSWLMTRRSKPTNPTVQSQQRVMNIVMPIFMAFITLNLPCGVGVYWITSNIFQIIQQIVINDYYKKKLAEGK